MKRFIAPGALAVVVLLGVSSCTNPYDPVQRTVGGGLLGAGAGAAIGAAAAGGGGAATGALIGGAVGAVAGAVTTPPPPAYAYGRPRHRRYARARRCPWGMHWVHPHHTRSGRWVAGHCFRNR